MLPGLSAAPLLAAPMAIAPGRRKLTNLKKFNGDSYHPRRDVALFTNGKQTIGTVNPPGYMVELISGNRYSAPAVLLGKPSGFNDNWELSSTTGSAGPWHVIEDSYAGTTFMTCGFDLPDGYPPRRFLSSDILWSNFVEGTGTLNLTIPTSTGVTEPSIVVAAYGGFGVSANSGMTTIWDAPEWPDITAQRTGDYGIITSLKASAYADGAPSYDINLQCASGSVKTLSAAIIRIPT